MPALVNGAVHFKVIQSVHFILIYPVHLIVIWAVHLKCCNQLEYGDFILESPYSNI